MNAQTQIADERTMANAIRALAMDAVQKANSSHPGMPMGMADVATVLFNRFITLDPTTPDWPTRDRLVLSAGHPENGQAKGIEAAIRRGWDGLLRHTDGFVGMTGFGASAPAPALDQHFKITPEATGDIARTLTRN